ncbi:23S rRNA methyltransferase [Amycolatopsis bartoniae]|uniref:23S rRNA methyltransferase n=1 Tax=Amycolatopsis bartoniae TaxID=941986 RepID=A0A8H9MDN5_9PSEU|nr:23S rRNA methyltransferase [Amycolatopsis bartoniae]
MDVIVIGFGAAGACAAIEAADAGASVLVLDRFVGGGATALSGGVVYAGGGTEYQRAAGVDDSVDAMHDYLRLEVGSAVSDETLRRFCEQSADMIGWLEGNGVPFGSSLCPYKTSYPNDDYYLYYSGSETAGGFREAAKPAARGHRVKGPGTSGKLLFARLAAAARRRGVEVLPGTRATELVTDADGRVNGVRVRTLRDAPRWVRSAHRALGRYAAKPGIYVPVVRKALSRRAERLERRYAREDVLRAERGVVITAGGFIANRAMVREHAPAYRGGLALGTTADDGSGIRLGTAVGGATAMLDRVTAWRFVTPPSVFVRGLIVDAAGQRVIDESRYGAAVGEALITRHDAKGWLLVDDEIVKAAERTTRQEAQWFQWLQMLHMLRRGRVHGSSLADVANRAGIDPDGLQATVEAYNAAASTGAADPAGKPGEYVQALRTPPYSLLDISIKPSLSFPCPMLTLGGLVVDEHTGQVRDETGAPIAGLYAAGRSAAGICSRSYVSGLSLADCVFSGRRAGVHAARRDDKNENVF